MYQVKEQDWQLFRKKLPLWQEAHMDRLNQEYMQILSGNGCGSDKFWKLAQRIRTDKKSDGVVADMRRSQMYSTLFSLLVSEIILEDDLSEFSEELSETVKYAVRQSKSFVERI